MIELQHNSRALFCGITQHGKSTLIMHLLERMDNFIYYNTKAEEKPLSLGMPVSSIQGLRAALVGGCTRIIYTPIDLSPEHYDEVCRFVFDHCQDMTFIPEEVQTFASYNKITPGFLLLITQGEGDPRRIGVWATSQEPVMANWRLKTQCRYIVSFALDQKAADDLQKMREEIPADRIVQLPRHEFMIYDMGQPYGQRVKFHPPLKMA